VGELIAYCRTQAPTLEPAAWDLALVHERSRDAGGDARGGRARGARGRARAGFATALWTNNARALTLPALERLGLAAELELVVTRDDMRALKPDPDGWRVIAGHFKDRLADGAPAVVVGDSWVDGVAAAKAGVPFVAYPRPAGRARSVAGDAGRPSHDLALLPAWLAARGRGRASVELFGEPRARRGPPRGRRAAGRSRPTALDRRDRGQEHLLGPGRVLRAAIETGELHSMILWGPPGSGKTTLASLMARVTGARFVAFSAVLSGVKEIREVIGGGRPRARPSRDADHPLRRRDPSVQPRHSKTRFSPTSRRARSSSSAPRPRIRPSR